MANSRKLENVFTKQAVNHWEQITIDAWNARKDSPDAYLHALPFPGHRMAIGNFSEDEILLFHQNLTIFRQKGWPITYWGIFSIAFHHRTGAQCKHVYFQNPNWHQPSDLVSPPLSAIKSCLEHHKPIINSAMTSPLACQVAERVNAWLKGDEPSPQALAFTPLSLSANRQHQHPPQIPLERPPLPSPLVFTRLQSNTTSGHLLTPVAAAPIAATASINAHHQTHLQEPPLKKSKWGPNLPQRVILPQLTKTRENKNSNIVENAKGKKKIIKKITTATTNAKMINANRNIHHKANDEDEDDGFMEGSLRRIARIPIRQSSKQTPASMTTTSIPPTTNSIATTTNTITTAATNKRNISRTKKKRFASHDDVGDIFIHNHTENTSIDDSVDAENTERIITLRLDKEKTLPGWGRHATPYIKNTIEATRYMVKTRDILSFDFSSLLTESRRRFVGCIINAPIIDDAVEPLMNGITIKQLSSINLQDCLAQDSILCCFASKSCVGKVVNAMASSWGCKYVENLTWVHLESNYSITADESPYILKSHSTLIMGRCGSKGSGGGGGELELRHQRTVDVIVAPRMGGGRFPDSIREMLEVLLPDSQSNKNVDGAAAATKSSGDVPRLLEVAFHGVEATVRPGWMTLALDTSIDG